MNLQYQQYQRSPQYIRQLRGSVGSRNSWRQSTFSPRAWVGESVLGELPPISWGGGHNREDLVQDGFHAHNRTWTDDSLFYMVSSEGSHHSFISLSDDDDGEVSDRGEESLLGLLEHTGALRDVLEPVEPFHREPRGRASFPPGSRRSRGRGPSQPRPRRSAWWNSPQVPVYPSIYTSPTSTAWWSSMATRQPMGLYQHNLPALPAPVFRRSIPVRGVCEPDIGVDRTAGDSPLLTAAVGDTDRDHRTGSSSITTARSPGCQLGSSKRRPCHSIQEAEARCLPRPVPVYEEEDLVVPEGPRAPLRFRLPHHRW